MTDTESALIDALRLSLRGNENDKHIAEAVLQQQEMKQARDKRSQDVFLVCADIVKPTKLI